MSISDAIAPHIPFLRRFARALCGTQAAGDAYVAATLEEILADPGCFDADLEPSGVQGLDEAGIKLQERLPAGADDIRSPACRPKRGDMRCKRGCIGEFAAARPIHADKICIAEFACSCGAVFFVA